MLSPKPGLATRFVAILSFIIIYYLLADQYGTLGILLGWVPSVLSAGLIMYFLKDWMVAVFAVILCMVFVVYVSVELDKYFRILNLFSHFFS